MGSFVTVHKPSKHGTQVGMLGMRDVVEHHAASGHDQRPDVVQIREAALG